jgi:hypothetical protein
MAEKHPAYERRLPRDRRLRASDGDRDAVTGILQRAHVSGRLDAEEFQERLDRCLRAKTYAELDTVIADLPSEESLPRRVSLLPLPVVVVPLALVAAIAVSHGRLAWLAFPLFFFVARPLIWRARVHRYGPGAGGCRRDYGGNAPELTRHL